MVSPKASLLIAARHSSGEVCSIKKYPNLRLDVGGILFPVVFWVDPFADFQS